MSDGTLGDGGDFALKERLKHWFGASDRAKETYKAVQIKADRCTSCGVCMDKCPYGIDIITKLSRVDYKLSDQYGKILL
jgi:Fe-S oxidoreductase